MVTNTIQWGKNSVDNAGMTRFPHDKIMNLDSYLIPCIKINLKEIKSLNVRLKTAQVLEKNRDFS